MPDNTKQMREVRAKRTAKNSVFLDLFQDKQNLLKLYKTLHPEDTEATEDTLDIVTIDNVLTDNLYKRRKISAQYHLFLARRLSGLLCNIQSPNIYITIWA